MNRRKFLKLLGLTATAATAGFPFAWASVSAASKTVAYGGRVYRSDGSKIYVSVDSGRTWKTQMNLGSGNSVTKLSVDKSNQLQAAVAHASWTFGLILSPDQTLWLTA